MHCGKVADYPGPAEEADSQPTHPQSNYSIAIKRYKAADITCQERICQLEETLNKISELKKEIEHLRVLLNNCQSKISNAGGFRIRPSDSKEQLKFAQVNHLNVDVESFPF